MTSAVIAAGRSSRWFLGWPVLLAAGALVYAATLIATLPARLLAPPTIDAVGTVWHGEAAIGGGHVAAWSWSPLASLARFGLAGNWTIDGPGTVLRGNARWRPFLGVDLDTVAGRVGWPLVALAAPSLPFACDLGASVSIDRISLRTKHVNGTGTITGTPGVCTGRLTTQSRVIPRLVTVFGGGRITVGSVAPWANRTLHLADFTIAEGVLKLHIGAGGSALIPGSPGPSDLEIEL